MCYAIASLQLLFSIPKFSQCFAKEPGLDLRKSDQETINYALDYLATCSLHKERSGNDVSKQQAEVIFKNIAQKYCGLDRENEHDPAEFTSKFIEYLTKTASTSFKISRDMFETEIMADSVTCQE
jgi:hypothetical protein